VPHTPAPSTLIIVPTFNEAGNIESTVRNIHAALPAAHILIVDDSSPDGTGAIADRLRLADDRVSVLHRVEKDGLGAAYLAGFTWALQRPYEVIGEFDADGSHPAEALPRMLDALADDPATALVIGSRWVPGGSVVDWPASRRILSRGGNLYVRLMLHLPVADATAGYRLYRASTLRSIDLSAVESKGYCFQVDLTLRVHDAGGRIAEVPIQFREREIGESKMTQSIVVEAMSKVTVWGVQRAVRRVLRPLTRRRTLPPRR
jgi:dolichol-phosphate mannosyltransferase